MKKINKLKYNATVAPIEGTMVATSKIFEIIDKINELIEVNNSNKELKGFPIHPDFHKEMKKRGI